MTGDVLLQEPKREKEKNKKHDDRGAEVKQVDSFKGYILRGEKMKIHLRSPF